MVLTLFWYLVHFWCVFSIYLTAERDGTPYFHEVKIQFVRQNETNLKSNFKNKFYSIDPLLQLSARLPTNFR